MKQNNEAKKLHELKQAYLEKLQQIVSNTTAEEDTIMNNLLHPPNERPDFSQRLADAVARFGGSWAFIILFLALLACWIIFNTVMPRRDDFDPYPFILMNLVLSCVAALQAPVIMMSQNRQAEKDRKQAENDYLINMKAELEVRALHKKLDLLLEEQMRFLVENQAEQLQILQRLAERLDEQK